MRTTTIPCVKTESLRTTKITLISSGLLIKTKPTFRNTALGVILFPEVFWDRSSPFKKCRVSLSVVQEFENHHLCKPIRCTRLFGTRRRNCSFQNFFRGEAKEDCCRRSLIQTTDIRRRVKTRGIFPYMPAWLNLGRLTLFKGRSSTRKNEKISSSA